MIEKALPAFARDARKRLSAAVDDAAARRVMERFASREGWLTKEDWAAAIEALGRTLAPKAKAARSAGIEEGLDRFAHAAARALKREAIGRSAARRAMAAHADAAGRLDERTFYAALKTLFDSAP